jgi:hemerythrin-like domain-containing protein
LAHAARGDEHERAVSPTEDLMREHGILRRLLLVYAEVSRRIDLPLGAPGPNQAFPPQAVTEAAQIVRAFIEDYHERDEEEYVFPRMRRAKKLVQLVEVLSEQHQAGRKLTSQILQIASRPSGDRRELGQLMQKFIHMYEPHAAREDTVLFPAFANLIGDKELAELQELFERKEKALPLGDFEKMVERVGHIEQALGIYDLALATPRPS